MELRVKADDPRAIIDAMGVRIRQSFRKGTEETTQGLKAALRGQVKGAGLGDRLANTWQGKTYPRAGVDSWHPAGVVSSKAPTIVRAFDEGTLVRSKDGLFLAVPTPAAPKRGVGGGRISPANFPEQVYGPLHMVYRPGRPSLLVVNNARVDAGGRARSNIRTSKAGGAYSPLSGRSTVVMFILIPQVRLRKRLDVAGAGRELLGKMPGLIEFHLYKGSTF